MKQKPMGNQKNRPGHRAPKGYDASRYERPSVACDVVIVSFFEGRLQVLLIQRKHDPYQGAWALPGGFVNMDEPLESAAAREACEETSLADLSLIELGAFGEPDRDPRTRVISVAYLALVRRDRVKPRAGDDAREARWFSLRRPPKPAFDHAEILLAARRRLRELAVMTPRLFDLLPREFAAGDFLRLCSEVMGRDYDESAFFEAMSRTPGMVTAGEGRYRYRRSEFHLGDFMFLLLP